MTSSSANDRTESGGSGGHAQEEHVRRSREETTKRILDAAEELFAEHNPTDVSVREVAERAGVTHALVHQYVGTKDDLINAVVQRAAPDRHRVVRESPDIQAAVAKLFPDVLDRKLHSRTMVRSAMDSLEYAELGERIVTGEMLIDLARASVAAGRTVTPHCGDYDPRIVVASVMALAYGWVAIEDWLVQICELQDEDPAEVRRQLDAIAACMTDLIFPAQVDGAPGTE